MTDCQADLSTWMDHHQFYENIENRDVRKKQWYKKWKIFETLVCSGCMCFGTGHKRWIVLCIKYDEPIHSKQWFTARQIEPKIDWVSWEVMIVLFASTKKKTKLRDYCRQIMARRLQFIEEGYFTAYQTWNQCLINSIKENHDWRSVMKQIESLLILCQPQMLIERKFSTLLTIKLNRIWNSTWKHVLICLLNGSKASNIRFLSPYHRNPIYTHQFTPTPSCSIEASSFHFRTTERATLPFPIRMNSLCDDSYPSSPSCPFCRP